MATVGAAALESSRVIAHATTETKNKALASIAEHLSDNRQNLLLANLLDMDKALSNELDAALLDRLELNNERIDAMIEGLHQVASLSDPVGEMTDLGVRPSGIKLGKMRTPIGVIGIIYESRPNVTIDAASLCLKAGHLQNQDVRPYIF